jgi:hypothetical protein
MKMKTLLEKLDRRAGRWLSAMDSELQQPLVRVITGEVFTHGASPNGHIDREQSVQQAAQQSSTHAASQDVICLPRLRNADSL